jgi:hypothetical protein
LSNMDKIELSENQMTVKAFNAISGKVRKRYHAAGGNAIFCALGRLIGFAALDVTPVVQAPNRGRSCAQETRLSREDLS